MNATFFEKKNKKFQSFLERVLYNNNSTFVLFVYKINYLHFKFYFLFKLN